MDYINQFIFILHKFIQLLAIYSVQVEDEKEKEKEVEEKSTTETEEKPKETK